MWKSILEAATAAVLAFATVALVWVSLRLYQVTRDAPLLAQQTTAAYAMAEAASKIASSAESESIADITRYKHGPNYSESYKADIGDQAASAAAGMDRLNSQFPKLLVNPSEPQSNLARQLMHKAANLASWAASAGADLSGQHADLVNQTDLNLLKPLIKDFTKTLHEFNDCTQKLVQSKEPFSGEAYSNCDDGTLRLLPIAVSTAAGFLVFFGVGRWLNRRRSRSKTE